MRVRLIAIVLSVTTSGWAVASEDSTIECEMGGCPHCRPKPLPVAAVRPDCFIVHPGITRAPACRGDGPARLPLLLAPMGALPGDAMAASPWSVAARIEGGPAPPRQRSQPLLR